MGKSYVRLAEVRAGTKLMCDGGFDCMDDGDVMIVHADGNGELYIQCECGQHYLDSQHDDVTDALVGLYLVAPTSNEHPPCD